MEDPRDLFPYESGFPDSESIYRYIPGESHPVHLDDKLHSNQYRILHKLGYGSFCSVWGVRDEQEQKYVAIKVPIADAPSSREIETLTALAASEITHPGKAYLPVLLDDLELDGSNGTHRCIVTGVYGLSVGLVLEVENVYLYASAARRL
ncbi:hypothetical protein K470DRAFT_274370 [Piedraia hortae CBS 480.64]|uniref:non-specific serine/threonine protein kinase n=1 Tax=Piedraia hortae CBS 480.64 TaxID=1314780 RepID=A0A6A7C9H8_9PEZI|nr:hypothetical protein K470DRAFT_274370 [Piedraia hortae CBS 480.64]